MKTLGLIGGCGAESTSLYYARINQLVRERLPGHGAKLLLWSFDFDDIDAHCRTGDWDGGLKKFEGAARWLEDGGADAVLLCTNTMHRIADPLAGGLRVPLIHIIDETAKTIRAGGLQRPVLLGTRFTMKEAFYRDRLAEHGLTTFLPSPQDQEAVHAVIYEELIEGRVTDDGRQTLVDVVEQLVAKGADSVILGCTELGMLLRQTDLSVPVFDTAEIHAQAAVAFVFGDGALEAT